MCKKKLHILATVQCAISLIQDPTCAILATVYSSLTAIFDREFFFYSKIELNHEIKSSWAASTSTHDRN
jgi:hypothetical protein